jgi:hypothetical protein
VLRAGIDCRPLEVGSSDSVRELATVLVAAHGWGRRPLAGLRGVAPGDSRAGLVEYMQSTRTLLTAPPRFEHSGGGDVCSTRTASWSASALAVGER